MIRIGVVLLNPGPDTVAELRTLAAGGFESFQIAFKNTLGGTDLRRLADDVAAALAGGPAVVSSLGIYGNGLASDRHGDEVRSILSEMIEVAPRFGTDLVCCFAGRVTGASIPDSIPRFREVFSRVAAGAEDRGIRIAFENCLQGGTWSAGDRNIAHNPAAWELMFEAVPSPALGLEWEPAHQLCQLIDPMPQLRRWAGRIFHVHGKDGEVRRDVLARAGCLGAERFCFHRFPGLGDSNWALILSELVKAGFTGSIDIEGGHDEVFRGDRESDGRRFALRHLLSCRA
jgi:sugar phosphate isomerase/epimerase